MLFKILHGDDSRISTDITPFHEGYCYVTKSGYIYVDMNLGTKEEPNNQRVKLNAGQAETLMGISLDELKAEISAQDAAILRDAQDYTDDALAQAKASADLKGEKGDPGVSVSHVWIDTTLYITSASGTSSVDLKGAKGDPGEQGEKGEDGYTPVRGTDYWTDADKAEIKSYVDDAILNGEW